MNVQVGDVDVDRVVSVDRNNIAVPITLPVAANVNVGATVCATILEGPQEGDEVCKTVQNVQQDATNRVTLNLNQTQ